MWGKFAQRVRVENDVILTEMRRDDVTSTSMTSNAHWLAFCIFLTPLWLTRAKPKYYFTGIIVSIKGVSSVPDQPCFVTMC